MGFFTRNVQVKVHGKTARGLDSMDGRYEKQVSESRRLEREREKNLILEPKKPKALDRYIAEKYQTEELPADDERVLAVRDGVKAHIAEVYAPELLKSTDSEERFREAVSLPPEAMTFRLHVYSIPVSVNGRMLAWLEVYLESSHKYLAFNTVELEEGTQYHTDRIIRDLVLFFGAGPEDQLAKNERYIQYCSVQ